MRYPYLFSSILLITVFSVIFILAKRFRKVMVIGGIASALYSLSAVFFVPDYWRPVLVIRSAVGLEDLLFSFANGGIVCFLALWPVRKRMQLRYTWRGLHKQYWTWTLFGMILCYLLHKAGVQVMTGCLIAIFVLGLILLVRRVQFWPLCLAGACGFTCLYTGVLGIVHLWFPSFHTQWTLENLWGYRFLSFPLEEYAWAFGFGAVFPMIMAFALELTLTNPNRLRESSVSSGLEKESPGSAAKAFSVL